MMISSFLHSVPVSLLVFSLWFARGTDSACSGRQSYVLSVKTSFTQTTLPSIPAKAKIPLIVAVTHKQPFVLFKKGEKVDDAVAEVIKHGRAEVLLAELEREKESGSVSSYSVIEDVPVDDVTKIEVTAEDDASMLSIMAPLSPSPAWFVGVAPFDLCVSEVFIPEKTGVEFLNFDSGFDAGSSWQANVEPYEEGENVPVGNEGALDDKIFARLSLEQGTLGVDWWKIFLGVLVAVAVVIVLIVFVYPRCRRKKPTGIPLTAPDGVQW